MTRGKNQRAYIDVGEIFHELSHCRRRKSLSLLVEDFAVDEASWRLGVAVDGLGCRVVCRGRLSFTAVYFVANVISDLSPYVKSELAL